MTSAFRRVIPPRTKFTTQKWSHPCELLIRAKMVPGRAGADTHVAVHIPLSQLRQLPGASAIEEAWIGGWPGEPGYLAGRDAEAAACDALTIPVVTGHADMTVIDKIIALALAAVGHDGIDHGGADPDPAIDYDDAEQDAARVARAGRAGRLAARNRARARARAPELSPEAAHALRYAIAWLAIDFVSGPDGLASALRTGPLEPPFRTPSLPLFVDRTSGRHAGGG
jgi:hypothetical protein